MSDQKISELTEYTALIDTDIFPMTDITAVQTKKTTWANIKSVLKTYFDTLYSIVPPGTISAYGASSAPSGWLVCDGAAVSRATYSALFAIVGTTYGMGDGSTTFNLPNLKGKVAVGYNSAEAEFDALGEMGGEKTHTLTINEMPAHDHPGTYYNVNSNGNTGVGYAAGVTGTRNVPSQGGGQAHNNLQPYITLQYIIKT